MLRFLPPSDRWCNGLSLWLHADNVLGFITSVSSSETRAICDTVFTGYFMEHAQICISPVKHSNKNYDVVSMTVAVTTSTVYRFFNFICLLLFLFCLFLCLCVCTCVRACARARACVCVFVFSCLFVAGFCCCCCCNIDFFLFLILVLFYFQPPPPSPRPPEVLDMLRPCLRQAMGQAAALCG